MSLNPRVCKKSYKVHIPMMGEECEFWLVRVTDEQSISNPDKDHAYYTDDGKLFIYDGKNLVRVNCDICFTQEEREKLEDIEEGANKYVLPVANDSSLGGIKTGFTQTEKQYAVEVTEEGQAYVTVPWTDTIYTLPEADTDTLGGVKLGYTQNGKNYPVLKDSEGNIYVAVPWVEYQLQQASAENLGGIKTGYEQQGQNYPVDVDVEGNAYVTVPWEDTNTVYEVVSKTSNGLMPMLPSDENASKRFLNGDGEWVVGTDNSINGVTQTGSTFSGETSDCGVQILEVQGKTSQKTTNGYQLFDSSKLATKSQGGATVTNNGDGSFTISGSGNLTELYSNAYIYSNEQFKNFIKKGQLKLNAGSSNPKVSITFYDDSVSPFKIYVDLEHDRSSGTITDEILNNSNIKMRIRFYGLQNSAIETATIKPMLYQDGDGTWEQYTGGKPAPNPDYAMPIENVEISNITSHGRQLFDSSKLATKSQGGATVTNNGDGSFTISGSGNLTELYSNAYIYSNEQFKNFIKKGQLKLNAGSSNPKVSITFYDDSVSPFKIYVDLEHDRSSGTITDEILNNSNIKMRIRFYGLQNSAIETATIKPMLYQDGDGTWEEFHGNTVETSLTLAQDDIYQNGITRARKQVVFDGSSDENWINISVNDQSLIRFSIIIEGMKFNPSGKCNRFEWVIVPTAQSTKEVIGGNPSESRLHVIIKRSRLETEDISGFKTWLSTHNLVVEYELATPTTEEYKVPTIPSYYPYTEVSTDSKVEPEITFKPLPYTTCLVGEATEEESGYMPKLSGNASQFLNGQGKWTTPDEDLEFKKVSFAMLDETLFNTAGSNFCWYNKYIACFHGWLRMKKCSIVGRETVICKLPIKPLSGEGLICGYYNDGDTSVIPIIDAEGNLMLNNDIEVSENSFIDFVGTFPISN